MRKKANIHDSVKDARKLLKVMMKNVSMWNTLKQRGELREWEAKERFESCDITGSH